MEQLFTKKQLQAIAREHLSDLLQGTSLSLKDYPCNVGTSTMNKAQLVEHIKLLQNTRYKLQGL